MKTLRTTAAALLAFAATGATAETMIYAEGLPPGHYLSRLVSEPLMACITEGTNGAIDFTYMPGGQLLKMTDGIDGLKKGLAQIGFASLAYETANLPLQGVTMLPGMSPAATEGTAAWRRAIDKGGALAAEFEGQGIKPLVLVLIAPYQIMGRERLDDPAKWAGKKIFSTGGALSMLVEAIGGVPVAFPPADIFVAMQQGTIDALTLSFASVNAYSVHEVATHYSTNMSLGTAASIFGMNLDHFNSLPEDQRKVIEECGRRLEMEAVTWIHENEAKTAADLAAAGHEIYEVPAAQLAAFNTAMEPVQADFVKRLGELGLPAQAALDEFRAALGE